MAYIYTANGELLTRSQNGQTDTFSYDAMGNLRSVALASGVQLTYQIDGLNRRIGTAINGTQAQGLLYGTGPQPLAQLDGTGKVVATFLYGTGNAPDAILQDGVTYRVVKDHLGSVRWVINALTGQVAEHLDYDAFGRVILDTNPGFQPFGFAGGLYDPQTGLVHFGARDYDPTTGRWTSKDPIGFEGGSTGLYTYVGNDPINVVDPSGLGEIKPYTPTWSESAQDWLERYLKMRPLWQHMDANSPYTNGQFLMAVFSVAGLELGIIPGAAAEEFAPAAVESGGGITADEISAQRIRELVDFAGRKYPGKAGKLEFHHVLPRYLGGAVNGTTVVLDAAYHQLITNAFRNAMQYGSVGIRSLSLGEVGELLHQIYRSLPLP